jgi:hypothetical protein
MRAATTDAEAVSAWREPLGMSLVGSLEDLGLGDILQIVHLSGKSGALLLRSESGEGQILFERGLVRAATTREMPQNLRELLARQKALSPDALGDATRDARKASRPLAEILTERGLLSAEAIDELRAGAIESAVLQMFRWRSGEFSFEVREGVVGADDLALARGISPQFLALEGTRHDDEQSDAAADEAAPIEDSPPSTEEDTDEVPILDATPLEAETPEAERAAAEPELAPAPVGAPAKAASPATRAAASAEAAAQPAAAPAPRARAANAQAPPIVVVDPSLGVLEWTKAALTGHPRVHAFQHTDLAIQRIRQYLVRREMPIVILTAQTPPDPVSGARDSYDVAARLRRQSPRIPIVLVTAAGQSPPRRTRTGAAPSAFAERPKDGALTDSRRSAERLQFAAALREVIERLTASLPAPAPPTARPDAELARLRDASSRMRERARQGEVLPNVLAFAAQSFARVALFMIRDETAVGIAQIGLAKAGGPDDAGLRQIHLESRESAWFRAALDTRQPARGPASDDGDRRLCVLLGNEVPGEAFVAPLESANRVVAILYADNLPGRAPLPETGALEVVIHEAGLALDRTLLERALAEAGGPGEARS